MSIKRYIFKLIDRALNFYWEFQYQLFKDKYHLPASFQFNGRDTKVYGNGELIVGENSYIGHSSQIQVCDGHQVRIGSNCRIASNVKIYTGTNYTNQDFSVGQLKKVYGDVEIGNNVWIGANVFIVPGVTIGENAIVGANSVVTRDLNPWTINAGVPANMVKEKTRE